MRMGLRSKQEIIIGLINEIKAPCFLSNVDLFQQITWRLYIEFSILPDELVTLRDLINIAIPVLEANLSKDDLILYQDIQKSESVVYLMGKLDKIKRDLRNGREAQMVANYERDFINRQGVS